MIGGRRFVWARARAALPALLTVATVAAISASLLVGAATVLRAVEADDVRSALAGAAGESGAAVVVVGDGDVATVESAVRAALASRRAEAVRVETSGQRIAVTPVVARFSGDDVATLAAALRALPADLREASDARVQVVGGLASTLARIDEGLQNRRGPAAVSIALLGLLALVVVGAAALEPGRSRAGESLLLRARGARRRSLGALAGVETAAVTAVGAAAGAGLALGVAAIAGLPSPGLLLAGLTVVAVVVAATVTALAVAVRSADTRSTRAQVAAFAGAAVVLAVITALAAWQFAQSGTPLVSRGDGTPGIDPLVAVAPALLLALAAVVAVLLATPLARVVARAVAGQRGMSPVTPLRLASRRPGRHALPIALVALAVGATSIAGGYAGTVRALGDAPEALRVGADLRVTTIPDTTSARDVIAAAGDGIRAAMPVRAFSARASEGRIPVIAGQADLIGDVMLDAGGTIDPAEVGEAVRPQGTGIPLAGDTLRFSLSTPVPVPEEVDGEVWQPDPTSAVVRFTVVSGAGEMQVLAQENGRLEEQTLEDGTVRTRWIAEPDYDGVVELGDGDWSLLAVDVSLAGFGWFDELTLHDVRSGGEAIDVTSLVPAPGTPGRVRATEGGGLAFLPEMTASGDTPATRALAPEVATDVPVVMTAALAASLGLEVGDSIALEFDKPDLEADVTLALVVPVLPGSVTGEGLLADTGALALLSPEPLIANQVWFATDHPDAAATAIGAAFPGPAVLVADPRAGAAAAGTAWGFVLAAAGAIALTLVVLLLRRTRTRADSRELALLAVFGLGRPRAARLRAGEDLFALAMGAVAGIAAGVVTAWLIVPPLVRAAYAHRPRRLSRAARVAVAAARSGARAHGRGVRGRRGLGARPAHAGRTPQGGRMTRSPGVFSLTRRRFATPRSAALVIVALTALAAFVIAAAPRALVGVVRAEVAHQVTGMPATSRDLSGSTIGAPAFGPAPDAALTEGWDDGAPDVFGAAAGHLAETRDGFPPVLRSLTSPPEFAEYLAAAAPADARSCRRSSPPRACSSSPSLRRRRISRSSTVRGRQPGTAPGRSRSCCRRDRRRSWGGRRARCGEPFAAGRYSRRPSTRTTSAGCTSPPPSPPPCTTTATADRWRRAARGSLPRRGGASPRPKSSAAPG